MENEQERNFLVGLLTENHELAEKIGGALGKPGQRTDLQFYDRLDEELNAVFCAIDAVGYPDKLKSLIHTMMITKYHLMLIDVEKGLTPANAEILVLMEIFFNNFSTTPIFVLCDVESQHDYLIPSRIEELGKILGATSLKDADILTVGSKDERSKIKEKILSIHETHNESTERPEDTVVLIDNVFPVKGIGTVILGTMKSGHLKVNDMLHLIGLEKKVIIRSIQKHDRDFKDAVEGERVGLAVKGVKHDSINRDVILAKPALFQIKQIMDVEIHTIPFYKHAISPDSDRQFTMFCNLASSPFKVKKGERIDPGESGEVAVVLTNPIPIEKSQPLGIIAELNKFDNNLRVVGYCRISL